MHATAKKVRRSRISTQSHKTNHQSVLNISQLKELPPFNVCPTKILTTLSAATNDGKPQQQVLIFRKVHILGRTSINTRRQEI